MKTINGTFTQALSDFGKELEKTSERLFGTIEYSNFDKVLFSVNYWSFKILQPLFVGLLIIPFTTWEAFRSAWQYCKEVIK